MKHSVVAVILILPTLSALSQGVYIGADAGASPDASAILDLDVSSSTDKKGILVPRMLQSEKNEIPDPATGLMVFQTDNSPGFQYYDGAQWLRIGGDDLGNHIADQNLELDGHWISNDGDDQGIRIRDNGNVGIGISDPDADLHVNGNTFIESDLTVGDDESPLGNFRMMVRNETNQDGLLIKSGDNDGDIALRIEDQDGSFNILDVEVDHGYFVFGETFEDTEDQNGEVFGIDNQNGSGNSADFNTENGVYRIAGEEITPYTIGGGIGYGQESDTDTDNTSSDSYSTIDGMSETPAEGTYMVSFSSSGRGSEEDQEMRVAIFVNGNMVGHSERFYGYDYNEAEDTRFAIHTQALVAVDGNDEIRVRFRTDDGTFYVYDRSMILIKVDD